MSTGAARAAVKDAQSRPITAGGLSTARRWFCRHHSCSRPGSSFHHGRGRRRKRASSRRPARGSHCSITISDGWLDIYLVNGSTFPAQPERKPRRGQCCCTTITTAPLPTSPTKPECANERWGFGAVVGDYDNDGWPESYVSNFGKNRLYHNNHDGTFTDVAEKAGVALGGWSTGATWGDYDHDGLLDLFVPGYVKFDPDHPRLRARADYLRDSASFAASNVMCGPRGLPGEGDHLFHNNGERDVHRCQRESRRCGCARILRTGVGIRGCG